MLNLIKSTMSTWQCQDETIELRYWLDNEETEIHNTYAVVWYSENGSIMAIEPFSEDFSGNRHYYNRISGSDLEDIDILGHGLMYEGQLPCTNALKYATDWVQ